MLCCERARSKHRAVFFPFHPYSSCNFILRPTFLLFLGILEVLPHTTAMADLNEKEAEIYDRQIRLWGVDAQKRIRDSRVLVVTLGALGTEVVKNLVLAGLSIAVSDQHPVTEADLGTCFFLQREDLGKGLDKATAALPRIQEMNTLVSVTVQPKSVSALSDEELKSYNLIIHCGGCPAPSAAPTAEEILASSAANAASTIKEQIALSDRCHALSVPVIIGALCGLWGFFASDLGPRHSYLRETYREEKDGTAVMVHKPAEMLFPALSRVVLESSFKRVWPQKKNFPFYPWAGECIQDKVRRFSCFLSPSCHYSPSFYSSLVPFLSSCAAFCEVAALSASASSSSSSSPSSSLTTAAVLEKVQARCASAGVAVPTQTQVASAARAFVESFGVSLLPVAACIGGVLGNEALKATTKMAEPICQLFLFDAFEGLGGICFKAEGLTEEGGESGAAAGKAAAAGVEGSTAIELD